MTLDILATVLTCGLTAFLFLVLDSEGPAAQRVPRLGALAVAIVIGWVIAWAIWS